VGLQEFQVLQKAVVVFAKVTQQTNTIVRSWGRRGVDAALPFSHQQLSGRQHVQVVSPDVPSLAQTQNCFKLLNNSFQRVRGKSYVVQTVLINGEDWLNLSPGQTIPLLGQCPCQAVTEGRVQLCS